MTATKTRHEMVRIIGNGAAGATVVNMAGTAAFYAEVTTAVYELRWMMLAVVALVAVDFVSGLTASVRLRGEDFRFSRAGRRTFGKLLEYFGYLLVGVAVGKGLEPLGLLGYVKVAALGLCFAVLFEVDSIAGHVCDLHGIKARFSIKRLFISLIKRKDKDLGEAVEDALETDGKEVENGTYGKKDS